MAVKYFDVCDIPFKRDDSTCELYVIRATSDGKVFEDKPSKYEVSMFSRNVDSSPMIDEETAFKLASNPTLSY